MLGYELKKLLASAGYGEKGGQERFRIYMADRHGMRVSSESVSAWLRGDRKPKLSHLVAILDAFAVHGDDRDRLIRLASGVAAPDVANRPKEEIGLEDGPTEDSPRAAGGRR